MKTDASVLVVIVNYRTAALVVDCLRSLQDQVLAHGSTRVTVVDNVSGDGSADVIDAAIHDSGWAPWATLVRAPLNGGFAYGNNLAVRQALHGGRFGSGVSFAMVRASCKEQISARRTHVCLHVKVCTWNAPLATPFSAASSSRAVRNCLKLILRTPCKYQSRGDFSHRSEYKGRLGSCGMAPALCTPCTIRAPLRFSRWAASVVVLQQIA